MSLLDRWGKAKQIKKGTVGSVVDSWREVRITDLVRLCPGNRPAETSTWEWISSSQQIGLTDIDYSHAANSHRHRQTHDGSQLVPLRADVPLQVETGRLALLRALEFSLQKEKSRLKSDAPPNGVKYLIFLLPPKDREPLLGDLEEDYRTELLPKFGPKLARVYYWWHVLRSMVPFIWGFLKQFAGLVAFWKAISR